MENQVLRSKLKRLRNANESSDLELHSSGGDLVISLLEPPRCSPSEDGMHDRCLFALSRERRPASGAFRFPANQE